MNLTVACLIPWDFPLAIWDTEEAVIWPGRCSIPGFWMAAGLWSDPSTELPLQYVGGSEGLGQNCQVIVPTRQAGAPGTDHDGASDALWEREECHASLSL